MASGVQDRSAVPAFGEKVSKPRGECWTLVKIGDSNRNRGRIPSPFLLTIALLDLHLFPMACVTFSSTAPGDGDARAGREGAGATHSIMYVSRLVSRHASQYLEVLRPSGMNATSSPKRVGTSAFP